MNRVKLYLDEDVNVVIAEFLRSENFIVATTNELGRKGEKDPGQLEFAAGEGYCIVTHNRQDFESLAQKYFYDGLSHSGIIILVRRPALEIAKRLTALLLRFSADEIANQIIYI